MNGFIRWLVGRPPEDLVNEAREAAMFYQSPLTLKQARRILDREQDFTAYEDDWQFDVEPPDLKFYVKQVGLTTQWRMRLVRKQSRRLSRYITKRYSDVLRDSLPQSTEVTR